MKIGRDPNNTSLKCCLPSTDAIERRENLRMRMKVQGRPSFRKNLLLTEYIWSSWFTAILLSDHFSAFLFQFFVLKLYCMTCFTYCSLGLLLHFLSIVPSIIGFRRLCCSNRSPINFILLFNVFFFLIFWLSSLTCSSIGNFVIQPIFSIFLWHHVSNASILLFLSILKIAKFYIHKTHPYTCFQ